MPINSWVGLGSNNEVFTGRVMAKLREIGAEGRGKVSMLLSKVSGIKWFENRLKDILLSLD